MYKKFLEGEKLINSGFIQFSKKDHLYYKVELQKDLLYKKFVFLATIVSLNKMKISKYNLIFEMQMKILKWIETHTAKPGFENNAIITVIDLREGISFIPDIGIISKANNIKYSLTKIDPAGMVIIIPDEFPKQQKLVEYVIKKLTRDKKLCVENNMANALAKLKSFLTADSV